MSSNLWDRGLQGPHYGERHDWSEGIHDLTAYGTVSQSCFEHVNRRYACKLKPIDLCKRKPSRLLGASFGASLLENDFQTSRSAIWWASYPAKLNWLKQVDRCKRLNIMIRDAWRNCLYGHVWICFNMIGRLGAKPPNTICGYTSISINRFLNRRWPL